MGSWLRALRLLQRRDRSARDWPWLLVGGRPNVSALLDHGPHIHWYTSREAESLLEATGFSIVFSGGHAEVEAMARDDELVLTRPGDRRAIQMFYVCTKG
jgi:hypothetical protein